MGLKHVAVGALMLVLIGQCGNQLVSPSDVPAATESGAATDPRPSPGIRPDAPGTALAALDLLAVKGRAPMTGYDRDRFGPAWLDADRNGCDTRNDVLREHLSLVALESNGCVVAAGSYDDPYTGARIDYRQGHGSLIDIDHVVSMANGWATGAFGWSVTRRAAFANDPLNLLPADSGANRQKGDGDAATWLPPNTSFRCVYVARQVAVKSKYGLWVTPPEKAAAERVLGSCPGELLPSDVWGAPTEVDHKISDPMEETVPAPTPPAGVGSTPFADCDAARAAGAAPVRLGDPSYGAHLDGDGDGVACE